MHPKGPDAGQGDRPGVGVADPDRGLGALGVLVADPERTCPVRALLPEPGVPDLLPGTLALARVRPRPQRLADINGGLLAHRLDHLPTSTAASGNAWRCTCPPQGRRVTTASTVPLGSAASRRPAAVALFHGLYA